MVLELIRVQLEATDGVLVDAAVEDPLRLPDSEKSGIRCGSSTGSGHVSGVRCR